jgi:hypothetical protein
MEDLDTIRKLFDERHVIYRETDGTALTVCFPARHVATVDLLVIPQSHVISVAAAVAPMLLKASTDRLTELLKLANYLNAQRVTWGAFWLQPGDGTLWFELAVPTSEGLRAADLQAGISAAVQTADFYVPHFARVLWAGASAESVYVWSEPDDDDEDENQLAV